MTQKKNIIIKTGDLNTNCWVKDWVYRWIAGRENLRNITVYNSSELHNIYTTSKPGRRNSFPPWEQKSQTSEAESLKD